MLFQSTSNRITTIRHILRAKFNIRVKNSGLYFILFSLLFFNLIFHLFLFFRVRIIV